MNRDCLNKTSDFAIVKTLPSYNKPVVPSMDSSSQAIELTSHRVVRGIIWIIPT